MKPCSLLVTQGRDGTTHIWRLNDELNIIESPPVRSFIRDAFSFCRFSLLAPEPTREVEDTTAASIKTPEAFVDAVLADDSTPTKDTEMKEESALETSSAGLIQNAIARIHTCSSTTSPSAASSSSEQKQQQDNQDSIVNALISIPSYSEKVVEVCCAGCCAPLAMFLQSESEAAALPEQDRWGMCMATKLFVGPKEVNNDVLLAVGYESGHVVLWSVTDAVEASAATAAAIGRSTSAPQYSPPKPLASAKLHSEPIMALEIDVDGYSGVSGSAEDALIPFSISFTAQPTATGTTTSAMLTIAPTTTINIKKQGVGDVALRPDGKLFASAGWDGKIRVYKRSNGKALAVFKYHSAAASAVAFSPRKFLIASGARDGTVALWDVYSTGNKATK